MEEINDLESLMVWIINHLAQRLGPHAILKGGMVLRLLDCQRYTNDIDYVFAPFKSKKEIVDKIVAALTDLEGAKVHYTLHSTSLRIILEYKNLKTQIEANVASQVNTQEISTASLSQLHNQLPVIIKIMKLEDALAHKMAAWNERNLMRDLFDIYFMSSRLQIKPSSEILKNRLAKINYLKDRTNKVKAMSLAEFCAKLRSTLNNLEDNDIKKELRGMLPLEEFAGLSLRIKSSLLKLLDEINNETDASFL